MKKIILSEKQFIRYIEYLKESLNNNDSPLYHFTTMTPFKEILSDGKLISGDSWITNDGKHYPISLTRNKSCSVGYARDWYRNSYNIIRLQFMPKDLLRLRYGKISPYSFYTDPRNCNNKHFYTDDEYEEQFIGKSCEENIFIPLSLCSRIDILEGGSLYYGYDDLDEIFASYPQYKSITYFYKHDNLKGFNNMQGGICLGEKFVAESIENGIK